MRSKVTWKNSIVFISIILLLCLNQNESTHAFEDNNSSYSYSQEDSIVIGISVTFGVGASKEFYDLALKETYWSWKDLIWDIVGGALGSYVVVHSK